MARTIVVTGSASGMGAATVARLEAAGDRVIGIDLHDAEIAADLGTSAGREAAIAGVRAASGGAIDGLVTWAGLSGLDKYLGSLLVSVNHFGTVALLDGLRPLLAEGGGAAAVAISSNSTTCFPGVSAELVDACLAGDEQVARTLGDAVGPLGCYPATKTAVARWVRRHAPTPAWAGSGITLNAVAPGAVETPLLQASREDPVIGGAVDDFPIPVGRTGRPDELAALVQFLLGPDARFICGSLIFADGGTDALLRADAQPTSMGAF